LVQGAAEVVMAPPTPALRWHPGAVRRTPELRRSRRGHEAPARRPASAW